MQQASVYANLCQVCSKAYYIHVYNLVVTNDCKLACSLLVESPSYLCYTAAVRSDAGTPQVPCTAVRSDAEIGLPSLGLSISQGASLGDFLLAPTCFIEKVTLCSMGGLLLFNVGIRNWRGCCERQGFAQTGNRLGYRSMPFTNVQDY